MVMNNENIKHGKKMLDCLHKKIKVVCKDGEILEGKCSYYTSPFDNDSEMADITLETKNGECISILENEIASIGII